MANEEACPSCAGGHSFPQAMHLTEGQVAASNQLLESVSVRPYRPEQDSQLTVKTAVEMPSAAETLSESATQARDGFMIRPVTPVVEPQAPLDMPAFAEEQPPRVESSPTPAYHFMNECPAVEGNSVGMLDITELDDEPFVAEDEGGESVEDALARLGRMLGKTEEDCRRQLRLCELAADVDLSEGRITVQQHADIIKECRRQHDECVKLVDSLRAAGVLARRSERWKARIIDALIRYQNCVAAANAISDPVQRAIALKACWESIRGIISLAGEYADLEGSIPWQNAIASLLAREVKDCPCCVNPKTDIRVNTSGRVKGVASHQDFKPKGGYPKNFPDRTYESNGFVQDERGWGFGIQISVGYHPEDCPCDCDWTQFVKYGDKWEEDRAGGGIFPTPKSEVMRRQNRALWISKCSDGRIYMGDYIQFSMPQKVYFRTMFFSSSSDCVPQYVWIDWMLEVTKVPEPFASQFRQWWAVNFTELGRGQA